MTTTTINLSWDVRDSSKLYIDAFVVTLTPKTAGTSFGPLHLGANYSSAVGSGLTPGMIYRVKVTSVNTQTQTGSNRTTSLSTEIATSKFK